jgi:uncharacterized cysteine cluster protein YcgN (CxxCxxCC family)
MINNDIISHIGGFLSQKELFFAAVVDRQWYEALFFQKKRTLKDTANDVKILHLCNNLCPCSLEKYYQNIISDFKLKRHICSHLNEHEDAPEWIKKYFEKS